MSQQSCELNTMQNCQAAKDKATKQETPERQSSQGWSKSRSVKVGAPTLSLISSRAEREVWASRLRRRVMGRFLVPAGGGWCGVGGGGDGRRRKCELL